MSGSLKNPRVEADRERPDRLLMERRRQRPERTDDDEDDPAQAGFERGVAPDVPQRSDAPVRDKEARPQPEPAMIIAMKWTARTQIRGSSTSSLRTGHPA